MADRDKETKQGPLTRVLQKHAGRAKERLLQNFGKADRTTDADFDLCVTRFNKQQAAVSRLQKEFKNYHMCLKAMQTSRKSLMDTVCELYEPEWDGIDQFLVKSEVFNQNFEDFCEKINSLLLTPVSSYIAQFPELTNKISKRNRKLLDYDNCRHNLQNLETMKKREEIKITKAREQLEEARNLFEVINSELHDELPALYDSRVSFFVSHLQCLYLAEAHFHNQDSTILLELNGILEALDEANKKLANERPKPPLRGSQMEESEDNGNDSDGKTNRNSITEKDRADDGSSSESASGSATFSTPPTSATRSCHAETNAVEPPEVFEKTKKSGKVEIGAGDAPGEHRLLYKVKGTYKYIAEDGDELSFNVGDIIDVIAYDDPEEQEEGWLMGVFNGKKGLFPANFTSRI